MLMFGVGPQEAHFEMNTYDIYKEAADHFRAPSSTRSPSKNAISLLQNPAR